MSTKDAETLAELLKEMEEKRAEQSAMDAWLQETAQKIDGPLAECGIKNWSGFIERTDEEGKDYFTIIETSEFFKQKKSWPFIGRIRMAHQFLLKNEAHIADYANCSAVMDAVTPKWILIAPTESHTLSVISNFTDFFELLGFIEARLK